MASRIKEDEKNERVIRGLLKLTENKRCINCNSMGPQYVCTNFWTFVCTACSGIHREFTHRVKSISMAKFTSQEVIALQSGGNQRAKETYLREWDPQRQSLPDSSNVERLRDFIRHVYVDKRYTGEKNIDKPPRSKMGDKEDSYDNRSLGGSRSPPYEDAYGRRYSDRSSPSPGGRSPGGRSPGGRSPGGRSPGYEPDSRQHGDYRRSPSHPEILNDWRRDDRFGNERKFEDRRDGESKLESRSPDRSKDVESSSPPIVRPVREILGENIVPLRIIEPPKANGGRTANVSVSTQRTASSSSLSSTTENPPVIKLESTGSLIDFDEPEPPAAAVSQSQHTTITQPVLQPASSASDNNWASFDFAPDTKLSENPSSVNTLESMFSQLSIPASVPSHTSVTPSGAGGSVVPSTGNMTLLPVGGYPPVQPVGNSPVSLFGATGSAAPLANNFSTVPPAAAFNSTPGLTPVSSVGGSFINATDPGHWPSMQHQQPSLFPTTGTHSNIQHTTPLAGYSNNQPWNMSFANVQGPLSRPSAQASQVVPKLPVDSQTTTMDVKSSGRQALPEDLFTFTYPSYPAPAPGWQTGPPPGMGFNMQYHTAGPMPVFPQQPKSANPFDFTSDPPPQTQTFPSMTPQQGALPTVSPQSGFVPTSSLDTNLPASMPPQSSPYFPGMPFQAPTYASAMPPRYMGQQVPSNMQPFSHQVSTMGNDGGSYGYANSNQQLGGTFSAPATPLPFSSDRGNPFG